MRAFAAAVITALVLAQPLVAQAEEEDLGPDEVSLKNGGMVRGTVVSVDPGEKVVIKVPGQDKPRTIPWSEVADVDRGKYKEKDDDDDDGDGDDKLPGYSTPAPKKDVASAPAGTIRVRVESEKPGVPLHRILGQSVGAAAGYVVTATHHEEVCTTPCDFRADASASHEYFFGGSGYSGSDTFRLSGKGDDINMRVDPGSAAARWGGGTLGVLGLTGIVVGVTGLAIDAGGGPGREMLGVGPWVGIIGGSTAVLAGGIWLAVANKTTFEFVETKSAFGTKIPTGRFLF